MNSTFPPGSQEDQAVSFAACKSYMDEELVPCLLQQPSGEGRDRVGNTIVSLWRQLQDANPLTPEVQVKLLGVIAYACNFRVAGDVPDGDAGEAFLKKMGDTLRHLCNAAPQDSTVYGPLRQSCIDAHLKIIETAELLMDLWKRAEAQGSTPEIDAEILTLADKIGKMSFNWCRFVRRPGGGSFAVKIKGMDSAGAATDWDAVFTLLHLSLPGKGDPAATVQAATHLDYARMGEHVFPYWLASLRMSSSYINDMLQSLRHMATPVPPLDQEGIIRYLDSLSETLNALDPSLFGPQHNKLVNVLTTLNSLWSKEPELRLCSLDVLQTSLEDIASVVIRPGKAEQVCRLLRGHLQLVDRTTSEDVVAKFFLGVRTAVLGSYISLLLFEADKVPTAGDLSRNKKEPKSMSHAPAANMGASGKQGTSTIPVTNDKGKVKKDMQPNNASHAPSPNMGPSDKQKMNAQQIAQPAMDKKEPPGEQVLLQTQINLPPGVSNLKLTLSYSTLRPTDLSVSCAATEQQQLQLSLPPGTMPAGITNTLTDPHPPPSGAGAGASTNGRSGASRARCTEQKVWACSWCGIRCAEMELGKLRTCRICRSVRYCSKACQKADWPAHKAMCKPSQAARERCGINGL